MRRALPAAQIKAEVLCAVRKKHGGRIAEAITQGGKTPSHSSGTFIKDCRLTCSLADSPRGNLTYCALPPELS